MSQPKKWWAGRRGGGAPGWQHGGLLPVAPLPPTGRMLCCSHTASCAPSCTPSAPTVSPHIIVIALLFTFAGTWRSRWVETIHTPAGCWAAVVVTRASMLSCRHAHGRAHARCPGATPHPPPTHPHILCMLHPAAGGALLVAGHRRGAAVSSRLPVEQRAHQPRGSRCERLPAQWSLSGSVLAAAVPRLVQFRIARGHRGPHLRGKGPLGEPALAHTFCMHLAFPCSAVCSGPPLPLSAFCMLYGHKHIAA